MLCMLIYFIEYFILLRMDLQILFFFTGVTYRIIHVSHSTDDYRRLKRIKTSKMLFRIRYVNPVYPKEYFFVNYFL